jgi:hypothetical protein
MLDTKKQLENAVPYAMEPVVYDFRIKRDGTIAHLSTGTSALLPEEYYTLLLPKSLKKDLQELTPCQRNELAVLSRAINQDFTTRWFHQQPVRPHDPAGTGRRFTSEAIG